MTTLAASPPVRLEGAGWLRRTERACVQAATLLWAYAVYDRVRSGVAGAVGPAQHHALQLLGVERTLGLNVEATVQHLALRVPGLVDAGNACYAVTHLIAPPIVLVYLYRAAPERYRHWRNVFVTMLGLALVAFWLYPVMPPRLMPGPDHLVDTASQFLNLHRAPLAGVLTSGTASAGPAWSGTTNAMAAMPSLHVAWAVWSTAAVWPLLRHRWSKLVMGGYPLAMTLAVLTTGNHWVLDVVGGFLIVLLCHTAVRVVERVRAVAGPASIT